MVKITPRSCSGMWREIFVWCLVSSLVIHFVSGLLAWYSLGGHPIAVYALPAFIVAGFFTPLFAGSITSTEWFIRGFNRSLNTAKNLLTQKVEFG